MRQQYFAFIFFYHHNDFDHNDGNDDDNDGDDEFLIWSGSLCSVKPYFQPGLLSVILTTTSLLHASN